MSTWTSKMGGLCGSMMRAGLFAAIFVVAGCLAPEPETQVTRNVLRSVALYDGDVVIRAPSGYCIDRKSQRTSPRVGFVLLASCEALSGIRGNRIEPLIMTVSVLPDQGGGDLPNAAEIIQSADNTDVISQTQRGDMTLVHFSTGGERILPGGDARYWRGGMTLNGHLIGLALYAPKDSPRAGAEGGQLLIELGMRMRRSSPDRPVEEEDDAVAS